VVDARSWKLNNNTISLDEETVIDVPPKFSTTKTYCASLGHKANHSVENNAVYDICWHPRFGKIKCIRTIRDVQEDEEVTVLYGYTNTAPKWYKLYMASVEKPDNS